MAWFGRKEAPPPSPGRTATNAPRDWPEVTIKAWVDNPGINLILVTGPLMEGLKDRASFALLEEKVYADGILRIPFLVTAQGLSQAVFTYPKADAAASAHFSGVRALLRQREGINAVYYAPAALTPASPATVLEPLDTPHFSRPAKERPDAEYALWWPSDTSGSFAGSEAARQLDRWFDATSGYASILFSSFVRVLELAKADKDDRPAIYGLPEKRVLVPIDGPGRTAMYLHASAAEGLWLAFDTRTDPARRDVVLKLIADLAEGIRQAAMERRMPAFEDGRVSSWWRAARAQAMERAGDATLRVGRIAEQGNARTCFPSVTSAADREARVRRLQVSDKMVALVRQAFEVATRMAAQPELAEDRLPEPGAEAPPNLHPLLFTEKAGSVRQASFHRTAAPDAFRHVARAIAESGGADAAVLVWDGIVRQGPSRTDAILARAQEKGQARSVVFAQLYTPRRKGQPFALMGNWEIHGDDDPLLPASSVTETTAAPAVSPELETFVRESIAAMVTLFTVGDPTATKLFRRGEPLWSPSMQVRRDGRTIHVNFPMVGAHQALEMAPRTVAREGEPSMAVFVYDHDLVLDGVPARELRLLAQAPGMPRAAVYAQSYAEPDPSRPFTLVGDPRLVGAGPSLLP